jgi:nickel superoxide dismutase
MYLPPLSFFIGVIAVNKKSFMAVLIVILFGSADYVAAHCEVPCGIYADQRRFESMLEDQETVAKAMDQIRQLADKDDALSHNQLARWVSTKEAHATATQQIIAQYFMTQRIKPTSTNYKEQLTAAHAVMIAAMKCKQNVDTADAERFRKAITIFHAAYEGK